MGSIVFFAMASLLLGLAIARPQSMFIMAFLLGGLPLTLLAGTGSFYAALGNMNAQAAYVLVLLLASAIVTLRHLGPTIKLTAQFWGLTTFLLFATCSLVWADDLLNGLRMLAKLATPLVFFLALAMTRLSAHQAANLERCLYLTCTISIVLACINMATGGAFAPVESGGGLFGLPALAAPYTSAANFSFLIMVGAICAYCRMLDRPRFLSVLLVALFSAAIVFAFVRITLVATLVGLVIVHFLSARRSTILVFLCIVAIAVPIGVSSDAFSKRMFFNPAIVRWSDLVQNPAVFVENINTSGRSELWAQANRHFSGRENSIGAGVGAVESWIASQGRGGSQLHSELFRVFLDLGWIGLALLVLGLTQFWLRLKTVAAALRMKVGTVPVPLRAALGVTGGYVVTLATDNSLNYVSEFAIYVFGLAAIGLNTARMVTHKPYGGRATTQA